MQNDLHGKDLLSLGDLTVSQVKSIIDLSLRMKSGETPCSTCLKGKTVILYFEKPSLRTRLSFEIAVMQLGGTIIYVNSDTTHSRRGEPLKDTARVISRYADGIVYRAMHHRDILEVAEYAEVPVVNALSDLSHPCQGLADYLTIVEKRGKWKKLRLAYVGDGNNVAHSLLYICSKMGIDISVACPKGFDPDSSVLERAGKCAEKSGAKINIVRKPADAVNGANIVYTDVWVSMGQEKETERRKNAFRGFKVDEQLMKLAAQDAIFMHDLPAHRGEEVDEDVIEGRQSVVFDQAENRLHVQKAILALILGNVKTKTR
jgi:ornithine carbamoyltransferase